jgi:hypothetical protein
VNVVKHNYIPGRGPKSGGKVVSIGKALAHLNYIQHRPGPDREKGGRELFNERDGLDARDMRKAIKRLGGNRVVIHRLTLAPEINVTDKKAFTRQVMADLSRDKGLDLEWFGIEHSNTDHHHIHVVVLGKDRNGTDVRIDMKDIDKIKEYSDRYLERWHPRELERSTKERETRKRTGREERNPSREVAKEERVRGGLELPWLHKKLIREQLQPYSQSRATPERNDDRSTKAIRVDEKPYQDTIEAAGKQWSKANNLGELQDLNEYLWDNAEERIPKEDYRKLKRWIKDKEKLRDESADRKPEAKNEKIKDQADEMKPSDVKPVDEKQKLRDDSVDAKPNAVKEKEKLEIEYQGEKFEPKDSYDKLTGLVKKVRENEERLPFDDYQKLRVWIEDADRQRFSGALEKELALTHKKFERSKTMEDLLQQEGGRVINPVQEQVMRNPIFGLWMKFASLSNELVRSIPLDDRLRDPLKEGRDDLEAGKKGIDARELERNKTPTSEMSREQLQGLRGAEKKDRDNRERIEQDIDGNKKAKARELTKQKEDKQKAEREEPYDTFDPWGMY